MSPQARATAAFTFGTRPAAGVLVGILALLTSVGFAFELERVNGNPCDFDAQHLFWRGARASVSIENLQPFEAAIAEISIARWNESGVPFRFTRANGAVCSAGDGIVTFAVRETGCGGEALGELLGVTRLRWDVSSGRLMDADIVLGPQSVVHGQAVFLQVALHELGHALGLAHSDACGSSGAGTLMRTELILNQPRLDRPQQDDVNGANFIYGGESFGPVPKGANSCTLTRVEDRSLLLPLFGVALLWVGRRLRRKISVFKVSY